ncbi:MAG TPA: tripartite tricarboxylate transporter substrate binding protein [Quisquiliibacterium sp.]|nr:MAG: tripartite tricarboxylate transporter substrate binding protein [Burkholderiaceae bacterium]HOA92657.1 tripartite tricarboxylate transporter substrate binding protein [Quisquiliibacterium sp.]HQD81784.1 tripartite tricarboxylate transporter substrate binding protein [Quisquiliibacterium sp.]
MTSLLRIPRLLAGLTVALGLPLIAGLPATAHAQADWPQKPVRIVVGFAPGGTTDITARIVAEQLSTVLKQTFVVENKTGAGGNVAATEVARAAPDGYTFLMGTPGTQAINQFLFAKMPYDTAKDFQPVSFVVRIPNVLMVHPSVPARTIEELIALARSKPGALTYGSPGNGSTGQLSTELFKTQAKIFVTHIPYRGSAPMLQDLMAGQIQMSIDNLPSALPHIKSGKLRALGVTSPARSDQLPDVPTIASVLPGFSAESWFVLMAPAGTPRPIVDRLSAEVDRILKRKEIVERFKGLGADVVGGTPESLGRFIADETKKWQHVVKVSGAKVD